MSQKILFTIEKFMYRGILLSLIASCLFGLVYYYPVLLRPLSVVDIFCWRLMMSFPAILLLVLIERQWSAITTNSTTTSFFIGTDFLRNTNCNTNVNFCLGTISWESTIHVIRLFHVTINDGGMWESCL